MKTSGTNLSVWSGNSAACIKISGRANFSASVNFKSAVLGLSEQGCHRFILDLTDCLLMDSTFVGVLAGLGRLFEAAARSPAHNAIELVNPNARITDLLDNLGVMHLFKIVQGDPPDRRQMIEIKLPPPAASDWNELSKTCLEAHRSLIEANPANAAAFQGVTRGLEEEIKRKEKKS